ncbi:MAG: BamA/TamA family outer membrane protein, partial [Parachlamydiaceae bacterium]
NLNYDSTNHPSCPTRGFRSRLEQEIAGFGGDQAFMGLAYLNTYYKLIGPKGVLKLRGDMRFIIPLFETKRFQISLNERLFLGGDSTIRGYRVYRLGPQYSKGDPRGGMSLQMASAEYTYYLHKKFSAFVFCDSGHLSFDVWNFGTMWTSIGFGVNLQVFESAPPVVLGLGFPLNPPDSSAVKRFFFNLGGKF